MENVIIFAILIAVLGGASWYIYKSKKSGKKCIGCPDGCSTKSSGCGCSCESCNNGCSCHSEQ